MPNESALFLENDSYVYSIFQDSFSNHAAMFVVIVVGGGGGGKIFFLMYIV